MKWVVLAIVLFIGGYTFITLHFRKPGPAYRPYEDSRTRATVQRLQSAGYQCVTASANRPADPQRSAAAIRANPASVQSIAGGLPGELVETLVDKPRLPENITSVTASASGNALMPYSLQFTCTLPDKKSVPGETSVYIKDHDVAIVPHLEPIDGGLLARSRESTVLLTLPAGTLQVGEYVLTLVGIHGSRQWTVQVH
jgi:hypothetical protein